MSKQWVAETIECTGYIDVPPTNKATIHAPINGLVMHINAVEGRKVAAGEELLVIADQAIAELKEAFLDQKLNLAYWENEFRRKEKLYKQEAISKKEFLHTQNTLEREKYAYQSLREQLSFIGITEQELLQKGISSKISIRSPLAGFVSDVFVNLGSFVNENTQMVEIINYDHIHLELYVYSADIHQIKIGQGVKFQLTGTDAGGWGYIQLIGKKVDEQNRSVLIHAHINETDQQLTIGSSITAQILTRADSVFCIPESAVIREGSKRYVFTEAGDQFVKTEVQIGRAYNDFAEVLNYQSLAGKAIVLQGGYYLME
jgi:cobalt-zinc-cadmium efflux system membrane fusion protein